MRIDIFYDKEEDSTRFTLLEDLSVGRLHYPFRLHVRRGFSASRLVVLLHAA